MRWPNYLPGLLVWRPFSNCGTQGSRTQTGNNDLIQLQIVRKKRNQNLQHTRCLQLLGQDTGGEEAPQGNNLFIEMTWSPWMNIRHASTGWDFRSPAGELSWAETQKHHFSLGKNEISEWKDLTEYLDHLVVISKQPWLKSKATLDSPE